MIEEYDDLSFAIRAMPDLCTQPAYEYAKECVRLSRFSCYVMVSGIAYMHFQAKAGGTSIVDPQSLLKDVWRLQYPDRNEDEIDLMTDAMTEVLSPEELKIFVSFFNLPEEMSLATIGSTMSEMLLCSAVDNYLTYLRDLLVRVYQVKPDMLKSSDTNLSHEFVLQFQTMDDLIVALAEKKAGELAYRGFRDYVEFWKKHGFNLFARDTDYEEVLRYIEIRNIIVHNRGVINNIFKTRLPKHPSQVGEHINYDDDFKDALEDLTRSAFEIDNKAVAKFKLELVPLRTRKQAF